METEKALASIALSDGRFAPAAKAYAGLLERNNNDADAYIGLADALAGLGKGAEAEANYRRAVARSPRTGARMRRWPNTCSSAARWMKRRRAAQGDRSDAVERQPVEQPRRRSLQMKGDFDGALEAYRHSLQIEPSKDAYSNLATTYYYSNRFPEAVENYERAVALGEHDYMMLGNLADALWQMEGRRDDAIGRYRRAILLAETELEATPSAPALQAQLGYFYGRIGDQERSQRYLAEALATGPDILYVQYFVGVAAADRGEREAALRTVGALVKMGYPPILLRSAPEFRSLLQDAEYKKLVGVG